MPKAGRSIVLLLAIFVLTGCATQQNPDRKFSMRGYIQDEPRVDQQVSGKIGNWENAPDAVDVERKKTRQVYYLELTKEAEEADKVITEIEETTETQTVTTPTPAPQPRTSPPPEPSVRERLNLPSFDEPATTATRSSAGTQPTSYTEYKVEKDDTLQKISMKFYQTNNKWPQIYEANKDVIKNPNFIKPGITIKIPAL